MQLDKKSPKISFLRVAGLGSGGHKGMILFLFAARLITNIFDLVAMTAFLVFILEYAGAQSPYSEIVGSLFPSAAEAPILILIWATVIFAIKSILTVWLSLLFASRVARLEAEVSEGIALRSAKENSYWNNSGPEFSHIQSSTVLSCRRLFNEYMNTYLVVASELVLIVLLSALTLIFTPSYFVWIASAFLILGLVLKTGLGKLSSFISGRINSADRAMYSALQNLFFGAKDIRNFSSWDIWSSRFLASRYRYSWWNAALKVLGTVPRHVVELFLILGIGFFLFASSSDTSILVGGSLEALVVIALRFAGSVIPLQTALTNFEAQKVGGLMAFEAALESENQIRGSNGADKSPFGRGMQIVFDLDATASTKMMTEDEIRLLPGHLYALTGPSGSGKTRLLSSLAEDLDKNARGGRVLFSGLRESFAEDAAFLGATPFFFEGSVFENVAMRPSLHSGVENDSETSRIKSALEAAQVLEEVENSKAGLFGITATGGSFSTGQLQRIAIARILFTGRRVLLLDEPTSALDQATELRVLQGLREYASQKEAIVLYSAHRKQAIEYADDLLELD